MDRIPGVARALLAFALPALLASPLAHAGLTTRTLAGGGVGEYSSIQLDASGRPVISFYDRTNGNLGLVNCDDPACTTPAVGTVDGDPADVGLYTSLQLGASGNPVISYFDANGFDPSLRIAICDDPACASSTLTVLDNTGFQQVGLYTSLALSAAGQPVVSYFDQNSGGRLMLIRCNDASCGSVGAPVAIDDPAHAVGAHTSVAITAGNPVISYYDLGNGDLKLATCADPDCDTATTKVLDSVGNVGAYSSLRLSGSNPVISYFDQTNNRLKLIVCANPFCGAFLVRDLAPGGRFTSLRLTADGNPVISYVDGAGLSIVVCNDPTCFAPTISQVAPGLVSDTSLALDAQGRPWISYHAADDSELRLAAFTPAVVTSVTLPADGNHVTGQSLEFGIHWSEDVTVTGAPELEIDIGGTVRRAAYVSGSGTATHLYAYTVDAADQDNDGIGLGSLIPNGGTLRDGLGFDAENGVHGAGPTAGIRVNLAWTVTFTSGPNGTIDDAGAQQVADGGSATITVTPDFRFAPEFGGTCPAGTYAEPAYTTGPIGADCMVDVSFTQVLFTATPSVIGGNGTILEPAQTLAAGDSAVFTLVPSPGYHASVGGSCGGTLAGNTYTTDPLAADCVVEATFTQVTYTATPSVTGGNGSILEPALTLPAGASAVFTVVPSPGYYATVGGSCGGTLAGSTYTTDPLAADCTVIATFAAAVTSFSGPTATGTGIATASFTGGGVACSFTSAQFIPLAGHPDSPPAGTAPAATSFPHGLFEFTTAGCDAGSTISLTITYPAMLPAGTQYWKYGPTPGDAVPHWYVLPATIGGNTVTFAITDGQPGDDDLAANGTIVDQGGAGVPVAPVAPRPPILVPTLGQGMLALLATLVAGAALLGGGLLRARDV